MIAKRVPHQFPSGPVEETIRMYEPMIVLFSLFYCIPAALAGWLIWRGLYPEQIVLNGVIFLFCLWRIAQQDKPLVLYVKRDLFFIDVLYACKIGFGVCGSQMLIIFLYHMKAL